MNGKTLRHRTLCLLLVALTLAGCTSGSSEARFLGKTSISVGMHNDLPGVSLLVGYQRSGLDLLIAQMVERELGIDAVVPTEVSSADRIPRLVDRKLDMVIASFSITADRMKHIDFVGPYLTTAQGFLVGRDGANVKYLSDLNAKRVCSWEGTTSEGALAQLDSAHIDVVTRANAAACVEDLKSGQVSAISTDQTILYGIANLNAAAGFRVVPELVIGAPQHYGIGLPKGHRKDCERLKTILKRYVGTSTWTEDIQTSLPLLPTQDPNWISHYKPNASTIDAQSCHDVAVG